MERHVHRRSWFISKTVRYIIVFWLIISLNFILPRLMPGDPVKNIVGERAFYISPEALDSLRTRLGLDAPLYIQYFRYLGGIFTGDWGFSYLYMQPVLNSITLHLKWTLVLILPAVILGAIIASVFGSLAAWYRKSRTDAGLSALFLVSYSMPHYWLAMLFLTIFSFILGWFPLGNVTSGGLSGLPYLVDVIWHMFLPLSVITIFKAGYDFLIVRNAIVSIYGEDYLLAARARGLSEMTVLFKHALRNAIAPLATVTAIQFGVLFTGAMLVEVVFSWPGMGSLIYAAIMARDYPLLQATFLIITICVLLANFIADVLYTRLDPRTR
ncbi:MAG: ABC transporter permease [Chloroflexi bacterium]|nr:ABC transporter permease [Chloroflexota bacterium]